MQRQKREKSESRTVHCLLLDVHMPTCPFDVIFIGYKSVVVSNRFRKPSQSGCSTVFVYNSRFVAGKKSRVSSSSWSDDDSDSNDAAVTSSRDVTTSRRAAQGGGGLPPSLQQLSYGVNADPVAARADLETFDVYYVLPSAARHRRGHLGPPTWTRQQTWDPSLTERRRPNTNCLLDAVPPTPSCCNERRAATLPASIVDNFVSIRMDSYLLPFRHSCKGNESRPIFRNGPLLFWIWPLV